MCVDMYAWAYVRMSGYFSGLIMDVTTLWVSDYYLCASLLETLFMGYDLFMYVSSSSMHPFTTGLSKRALGQKCCRSFLHLPLLASESNST